MKYLLDTNICIYIIKKKPREVLDRLKEKKIFNVGISTITLSELEYGIKKSSNPVQNTIALTEFLSPIKIYNYDEKAAFHYGKIRAELEKGGTIIGPMDLLIASQALALGHILVINNDKEFKRVKGLKVENWVNIKS